MAELMGVAYAADCSALSHMGPGAFAAYPQGPAQQDAVTHICPGKIHCQGLTCRSGMI